MQSHAEAIFKLDTPKSLKELPTLFGSAGYYRKICLEVLRHRIATQRVTGLRYCFSMEQAKQQAFEQLKTALTSAAVMAHLDFRLSTQVTTNASAVAINAVLSQKQPDDSERLAAYASRKLTAVKRA